MDSTKLYIILMIILVLVSGFFSGSETAMMIINKYKLKHKAKSGNPAAIRVLNLLNRPDRLLSVILTCNTFANLLFSSLSTQWAIDVFGELTVLQSVLLTVVISMLIMIFAESTPKIFAALHPEWLAYPASLLLKYLLVILSPIILFVTVTSNAILRLFGVKTKDLSHHEKLSIEELRTIITDSKLSIFQDYKNMLVGLLDLKNAKVEDIMIPKNEVLGIDINFDWEAIKDIISKTEYHTLPVYNENINNLLGILKVKHLSKINIAHKMNLKKYLNKPYFILEGTTLINQLHNFKKNKTRMGLVVDEYGEILGLSTLDDILEEIIGEFTTDISDIEEDIIHDKHGNYIIDGTITLRELNKKLNWHLNTNGPKTLSGLLIDYLESIPQSNICIKINNHKIEILEIHNKLIKKVRIYK